MIIQKKVFYLFKQLFLYGIIGAFSSGIDAILFHFLVYRVNIYSIIANIFSVLVGILISFFLNLNFNFKVKDRVFVRFLSFFAVGVLGLLLSTGIIALGEKLDWDIFITKIESIFIVAMVQFILNKLISFRTKKYKE